MDMTIRLIVRKGCPRVIEKGCQNYECMTNIRNKTNLSTWNRMQGVIKGRCQITIFSELLNVYLCLLQLKRNTAIL